MSNQLQSINDIKSFMKEYTESFKTHINRTQKYQDFMISQYASNLTAGKSALANKKLIEGIAGAMHYDSDSWGENAALVRLNLGTIFGYENAEQLYNLIIKRKKQGNFDKKSEYKKYSI